MGGSYMNCHTSIKYSGHNRAKEDSSRLCFGKKTCCVHNLKIFEAIVVMIKENIQGKLKDQEVEFIFVKYPPILAYYIIIWLRNKKVFESGTRSI
jgi:hypothetical protein